jgi:hypothetical protein
LYELHIIKFIYTNVHGYEEFITKKGRKRRGNEVYVPEDTLTLEITCSKTANYSGSCLSCQMRVSRSVEVRTRNPN